MLRGCKNIVKIWLNLSTLTRIIIAKASPENAREPVSGYFWAGLVQIVGQV
jgi:hypothetical protein